MDPYLGYIILWPSTRIPEGWAICNGALLPISGNEQLYSLLGTTYGGNGSANFGLPDMRARLPIGAGTAVTNTNYVPGVVGGAETVALTTAQMPAHTHVPTPTGLSLTNNAGSGLNVSATAATMSAPNNTTNVLAGGYSPSTDTNITLIDILNFGANTAMVQLQNSINVTTSGNIATINNAGSNGGHNNVQPTMGMNYIICTSGLYPVKP